jgi:hypothetical protein
MRSDPPPPSNVPTLFRSAQQAATKLEEEIWDDEGGHVMASAWRVVRSPRAEMPYTVILTHEDDEPSEHSFETMREAEDFIRRNTNAPSRGLSALFQRPPAVFSRASDEGARNDGDEPEIRDRLEVIANRLRQMASRDAACVLADGMSSAGIAPNESLQLIAAMERILGESARPEKA